MRRLYLDIDGTVNGYDVDESGEEIIKPALAEGRLQQLLESKNFDEIVIVSGWCTMVRDAMRSHRQAIQQHLLVERIRQVILGAFPDEQVFAQRCILEFENDNRGSKIDLNSDWYFIDDWARFFFSKAWGDEQLQNFLGHRILECDPRGDGSDIFEFLNRIPT